MTLDASEATLVVPLLLRGLPLFIVLPVANLTFRMFAIDAFTHGYRLKNTVGQLTISFATTSIIVVERHRSALHRTRLVEVATPFTPPVRDAFAALTHGFETAGRTAGEAHALAMVEMSRLVARQASFLTALDGFYCLIGVAVCGGLFAAWHQQIDSHNRYSTNRTSPPRCFRNSRNGWTRAAATARCARMRFPTRCGARRSTACRFSRISTRRTSNGCAN